MDWSGSFPGNHRQTVEGVPRPRVGLAVGRNLLLWNMLVAHLSDDPLRPYFCLAGLSAFMFTDFGGSSVPCSLQPFTVATRCSFLSQFRPRRAALMVVV